MVLRKIPRDKLLLSATRVPSATTPACLRHRKAARLGVFSFFFFNVILFSRFLAALLGMWNLSSLTRD